MLVGWSLAGVDGGAGGTSGTKGVTGDMDVSRPRDDELRSDGEDEVWRCEDATGVFGTSLGSTSSLIPA